MIDDLDLFASVYPADESLSAGQRADLRRTIFSNEAVEATQTADAVDTDGNAPHLHLVTLHDAEPVGARRPATPRRRAILGAAAVLLAGVGIVTVGARSRIASSESESERQAEVVSSDSTAPDSTIPETVAAETVPSNATPTVGDDGLVTASSPPLLGIDPSTGWTVESYDDRQNPTLLAVMYTPERQFNGPLARVSAWYDGDGALGAERAVQVGDLAGAVSGEGNPRMLNWPGPNGALMVAEGWGLNDQQMVALVNAVHVDAQLTPQIGALPSGFVVADSASLAAVQRHVAYRFVHVDGRSFDLTLMSGGRAMFENRIEGSPATIRGLEANLLDYQSNGRYRAEILDGFWDWEVDGGPFGSPELFIDTIEQIHVVDRNTWLQSMPADYVDPADRPAVVESMLSGIPLPDGFDVSIVIDVDKPQARSSLGVDVVYHAACAWLDRWFIATDAGDVAAAKRAADAMATSRQWPILAEFEDPGGIQASIWQLADAINGGPGIETGAGNQPPSRANTSGTCNR